MNRALLLVAALAGGAQAQAPKKIGSTPLTVAYFSQLQELPAFTAEEMAARRSDTAADPDAAGADAELNNWKLCVADALERWATLRPGPGTLVDGAFGRCADVQLDYRSHLMRISQDGRIVMDFQMAPTMTRTLEDIWRPRLIAAALDAELARAGGGAVK